MEGHTSHASCLISTFISDIDNTISRPSQLAVGLVLWILQRFFMSFFSDRLVMSSDLLLQKQKAVQRTLRRARAGEIEPLYFYLSPRSVMFLFPPFI